SSSGPLIITTGCISVPVVPAVRRTSSTIAFANTREPAVPNTPTRCTDGSISRNSSTVFAFDAADIRDTPVMFAPGRSAEGNTDRLPALAAELVRLKVDETRMQYFALPRSQVHAALPGAPS